MTTRVMSGLALLAAATGTLATTVIWTLLVEPTTMATAVGHGSVRLLLHAVAEAWR